MSIHTLSLSSCALSHCAFHFSFISLFLCVCLVIIVFCNCCAAWLLFLFLHASSLCVKGFERGCLWSLKVRSVMLFPHGRFGRSVVVVSIYLEYSSCVSGFLFGCCCYFHAFSVNVRLRIRGVVLYLIVIVLLPAVSHFRLFSFGCPFISLSAVLSCVGLFCNVFGNWFLLHICLCFSFVASCQKNTLLCWLLVVVTVVLLACCCHLFASFCGHLFDSCKCSL